MNINYKNLKARPQKISYQSGLSLIELMVAITIGLIITAALGALFLGINRTNQEMAKANSQIENGRFAMQLLQADIVHAGFWGDFAPQFDDLSFSAVPGDVPNAVPNPCLDYATPWTMDNVTNFIGIPVQAFAGAAPSGAGCVTDLAANRKANTDLLVVRHADTCVPGEANCEVDTAGKLYFQASQCEQEISSSVKGATATTITLGDFSSTVNDFYKGRSVRITSGTGAGQTRLVSAYDGSTKVATLAPSPALPWALVPDLTSKYTFGFGYLLDTAGFGIFHERNCTTVAEKRKFISNIYHIRDYAKTAGDGIPTLMISQFDLNGVTLAHQDAVPLIENIEGFKVMLGIDNVSDNGTNVIVNGDPTNLYNAAVKWLDSTNLTSPINRGDGIPDVFVSCTDAVPCTFEQLANVVAVKIYVLARAETVTSGYADSKTYTLGNTTLGPFNDGFKRHVFSTTIRVNNVSSRRETP
ncbi:MAG: PilW family protein [Pseudomonadota bacterium]